MYISEKVCIYHYLIKRNCLSQKRKINNRTLFNVLKNSRVTKTKLFEEYSFAIMTNSSDIIFFKIYVYRNSPFSGHDSENIGLHRISLLKTIFHCIRDKRRTSPSGTNNDIVYSLLCVLNNEPCTWLCFYSYPHFLLWKHSICRWILRFL